MLDQSTASTLVESAKQHIQDGNTSYQAAYTIMSRLKTEDGAVALGYESYAALHKEAFSPLLSRSMFYRVLNMIETVADIAQDDDTVLDDMPPERVTRPLNGLPSDGKQKAWQAAKTANGGTTPTSKQTDTERYRWLVENHDHAEVLYLPLVQEMTEKDRTPKATWAIVQALDTCSKQVRVDLMCLNVRSPALITLLAEKRTTETYREIVDSGCLYIGDEQAPVLAKHLTPQILRDELNRRAAIHRQSGSGHHKPVSILAYPDRPETTVKELLQTHNPEQLTELYRALARELLGTKRRAVAQ